MNCRSHICNSAYSGNIYFMIIHLSEYLMIVHSFISFKYQAVKTNIVSQSAQSCTDAGSYRIWLLYVCHLLF